MPLSDRIAAAARALVRTDAARDVREDATTVTATRSGAAVANDLSGLGGARDSGAMARPNVDRDYLDEEELLALLRGSVYRRIVELKPRWATARGWVVTDDTDEERPLDAHLRRLNVRAAIQAADVWGRALGESRILLVTDDPLDMSQPLDATKVRALHRLEVLDRREFTPIHFNADAEAGPLGEPDVYRVHPRRPGVAATYDAVHASRLLRFYGDELPPSARGFNGAGWGSWGADAIGQTLWDGLRHLAQTGAGGARLAQELSIAVFKLAKAPASTAGDQRDAYLGRIRTLNLMKSIANAVFLGTDDGFERVAANPSGFADLSAHAKEELALLTGYPLTLLFGIAPGGLGTDGESWQEAWRADVAAYQDERYRTPIERIVEVLYHAYEGGLPEEWGIEFRPLGDLTDEEKARIRLLHTQADDIAVTASILTAQEARSRYSQPGGFRYELQPVQEAAPVVAIDPAVEAEARALVEGKVGAGAGRTDATEGAAWIGLYLPDEARPMWSAARAAVEAITGPLKDPGDEPHVTVLYLGQVAPAALPEVEGAVREVAERFGPARIESARVGVFPAGADGFPVILDLRHAWALEGLNYQLLRRLAHLVSQRQFPEFRPHVTLGYARELTDEQRAAIGELAAPEGQWMAARLEVRHGDQRVAMAPLVGRADAGSRA
jgi:phage-related protein (TIGR01555 family)